MVNGIRPIETRYAGCRFRSRLEARWAVFFDQLGIVWEYEPQGYEGPDGVRYLPDFWLPAQQVFVEVKAAWSDRDFWKTIRAVPYLRRPGVQVRPILLVLGDVPRPGQAWTHVRVDVLGDALLWQHVFWTVSPVLCDLAPIRSPVVLPWDQLMIDLRAENAAGNPLYRHLLDDLTEPSYDPRLTVNLAVDSAYNAARSARFEYGEVPVR